MRTLHTRVAGLSLGDKFARADWKRIRRVPSPIRAGRLRERGKGFILKLCRTGTAELQAALERLDARSTMPAWCRAAPFHPSLRPTPSRSRTPNDARLPTPGNAGSANPAPRRLRLERPHSESRCPCRWPPDRLQDGNPDGNPSEGLRFKLAKASTTAQIAHRGSTAVVAILNYLVYHTPEFTAPWAR